MWLVTRKSETERVKMKFQIEFDENSIEPTVVIRCKELNDEVIALQKAFGKVDTVKQQLTLYKDDTEYFMPASEVIFFETVEKNVRVHTIDNEYSTKLKLYEIEEMFPQTFMRVSKSAIVNVSRIYAITRNITGCFVRFERSIKQVYVSRMYYKDLHDRLNEIK